MILNNTPKHEAVLSNVGEIGEFRIRNSAKAFSILSSGLYANKIRAIIRELSCNAVDSHVAAGCPDTPFDVHLPTSLEPWFSIRDYGTGLSHEQVTRIYTTYFESTKTGSNDFIGALGLGSKSPFSYTDNFTVAAVQNGVRGIYSAFINADGVPSIALMSTETSDQSNGVEIKFSVNSTYDYSKFREEANVVYRHFKLRPAFNIDVKIQSDEYNSLDIISGVHEYKNRNTYSVAIMGNIAYPIDVPNARTALGDLSQLLNSNLEIHFGIGELDFQASREGLSYVPQTIDAIKNKLIAINMALVDHLTKEVDLIENLWDRAHVLLKKIDRSLWRDAAQKYIVNTKFPLLNSSSYGSYVNFELLSSELKDQYNITIRSFTVSHSGGHKITCSNNGESVIRLVQVPPVNSAPVYATGWKICPHYAVSFIVNDTKKGAVERAKFHYRSTKKSHGNETIYILEPNDRTKKMDSDGFFKFLKNPPRVALASTLSQKERKSVDKDVTIMKLEPRDLGSYRRNSDDLVWRDAGKSDSFCTTTTHYYLPLNGFIMASKYEWKQSASELGRILKNIEFGELNKINVYGVRKGDIKFIESQTNWVNLEDHIVSTLTTFRNNIIDTMMSKSLDSYAFSKYNKNTASILNQVTNSTGKYSTLINKIKQLKTIPTHYDSCVRDLVSGYDKDTIALIDSSIAKLHSECKECYNHYPLLSMLEYSLHQVGFSSGKFAEYINSIDSQSK
jgi:hypothetical protein